MATLHSIACSDALKSFLTSLGRHWSFHVHLVHNSTLQVRELLLKIPTDGDQHHFFVALPQLPLIHINIFTMRTALFGITDYVVFIGMLAISAAIGIYYAFAGGGQKTAGQFLMAGRNMGVVPICLSLLASFLSGISLIGVPVEVYLFGFSTYVAMIGLLFAITAATVFYLPVFYKLEVTSAYEYLERRFHRGLRIAACSIFIFQMVMYMAIVTYAPALALSQVTGLHRWGCVGAIGGVCIFYTTVGGMKAVMWTDAAQILVMFISMVVVVIKGTIDVGGIGYLWEKNIEGGRLHPISFSFDPTIRHTAWGVVLGGFFTWLATYGTNQTQVQRFLTSPSESKAKLAVLLNIPGFILMSTVCCFSGLLLYAKYWACDPSKSGEVESSDQMVPILVMDLLGNTPGVPGLFVAGVFSGSLSTLSSGLNSLAAVTLEDLIKTTRSKPISEEVGGKISKILAVSYGVLCIAMVAVAERLGNITQATLSVFGIISGPLLGLFTLGMFFPWTNSMGATVGFVVSLSFVTWIGIGAQVVHVPKPFLITSTEGCPASNFSMPSFINETISNPEEIFYLYRISYVWYSVISFVVIIIIGLLVSFITGKTNPDDLDPDLLNCVAHKFFMKPRQESEKIALPDITAWENKTNIVMAISNGTDNVEKSSEKIGVDNAAFEKENHVTKI